MDIVVLTTSTDFKVIDIVDDTNTYPTLLEIDWVIDNQTIIIFNERILSFENLFSTNP